MSFALDTRTVLFFTAANLITDAEATLAGRIRGTVLIRSVEEAPLYGDNLESADGLAGSIPDSYKTGAGTTIDLALYPYGDVTPANVLAPSDFEVFPATPTISETSAGATLKLVATGAGLDETTGVITLSDLSGSDDVTWSSGTEATATVDTNGVVTTVANGTTVITASYEYDTGVTVEATTTVTVDSIV